MSFFEGFKPFNFTEGVPYISVTKNGVTFNKGVVTKLNCPAYVVLFINYNSKQLLIQVSDENTPNATGFYNASKKSNTLSVRWNGKDLLNTIVSMTGWHLDKEAYRVDGVPMPEHSAMLFDLTKSEPL